jgi:transcriptional regulator NrdR family protein
VRCPDCKSVRMRVLWRRLYNTPNSIRRRRLCLACNHRWSTVEVEEAIKRAEETYVPLSQRADKGDNRR